MARILLIEDEEPVRQMIRQMLEGAGHQVAEAADGAEGLKSFRAQAADLVITDILMPNLGGLPVIKEILSAGPPAPRVIAISGGGRTGRLSFLATARTFPGVRTLKKPFRRAELLGLVEEALSGVPPRRDG